LVAVIVRLVPLAVLFVTLGCSSGSSGHPKTEGEAGAETGTDGAVEGGIEAGVDAGFDAGPRIDDTTAQSNRAACKYARGALPGETLGASTPIEGEIPIDNIVIVMMENHSFDSYLGHLNRYGSRTDVESAPSNATNPDTDGGPQPWVHAPHLCSLDTDHTWAGTHKEIDNGLMDGFAQVNEGTPVPAAPDGGKLDPSLGSGGRALWWYDESDLPFYYELANTFAIADHYHSSMPGPTWPNRMYLYAATSFGGTQTGGPFPLADQTKYPYPGNPLSILDELEAANVSWMYYTDSVIQSPDLLYGVTYASRWQPRTVMGKFADFQAAASAGQLPAVSFVDPTLDFSANGSGAEGDEHPPGDIQEGQQFVSQVVQAVMSSPQWPHTALFITHDEHGGFFDHVRPPAACAPDNIAPILVSGDTTQGGFDLYGVRVILIAVSPYAKKGYAGHHLYDHTSLTRLIEARFNLPALTARDANAEPPTDLFDFANPPAFLAPPAIASPTIDPAGLAYCTATFGK
jgi:phospholipase C